MLSQRRLVFVHYSNTANGKRDTDATGISNLMKTDVHHVSMSRQLLQSVSTHINGCSRSSTQTRPVCRINTSQFKDRTLVRQRGQTCLVSISCGHVECPRGITGPGLRQLALDLSR